MKLRQALLPLSLVCLATLIRGVGVRASDDNLPARCGFHEAAVQRMTTQPGQPPAFLTDRPTGLGEFLEDPSGTFRIHYTRNGIDAVPAADTNANGVPDYVEIALESLLYALHVQVNEIGMRHPVADDGAGGSKAIDVYLRDLSRAGTTGSGLYGITRPDVQIGGTTNVPRFTSFLEIDNDFSPADTNRQGRSPFATYGIDALQATCAHELTHAIQIGSYAHGSEEQMIYEMWATWMELRCYPHIRDWAVYVNALLERPDAFPFSRTSASNGYAWGWFGNVLALDGGTATMRESWDRIAAGERPYQALVNACASVGPSFADRFCKALDVLYHTGQRGAQNSVLPQANLLREITLGIDDVARPPLAIATSSLEPFEVGALRWTVPGPSAPSVVTLMLTNTNVARIVSPHDESEVYTVRVADRSQQGMPIDGTAWWIHIDGPQHCSFLDGIATRTTAAPFPMPVKVGVHQSLYLPSNEGAIGDEATVRIYNASMLLLTAEVVTLGLRGSTIVAAIDVPAMLRPGVYIAVVDVGEHSVRHKVAVE
jgi:hypothetical protein